MKNRTCSTYPFSLGNTTSDPVSAGTIQIPTGESGQDCSFTGATPVCAPMTLEEGSIFGFENPKAWTATGFPITTVSTPKTEGSFALQVGSSGFREIFSAVFSTSILTGITPKRALDVYLPAGPSNPFWLGAVQLYANCPSAGIYHAYQGEIELTGKPSGAFSTVTFNLASQVVAAMKAQHSDFSLSIAVNASPAQQSFVLDNLHFTQ